MGIDRIFKALADPTRREVLRALAGGERSAGELAERFETTKPTLSHHFNILRDAGLIRSRKQAQQVFYALDTTVAEDVLTWMYDLFGSARPRSSSEEEHTS